jgi:alkylation response protein AidB-like acyl-CoA dehydrogenase
MIPALQSHEIELRDTARRLARTELAPHAARWDEEESFPFETYRRLCGLGFGAIVLPRALAGAGVSNLGALAVFEALAEGDAGLAFALLLQTNCARSIWQHGSEAQRAAWLPTLVTGERIGAYVITEPNAGSDPVSMTSTAVETPEGWRLDGEKWLLTNAPLADLYLISAKTDPEQGARGITTFLVPRGTAGLEIGPRMRTHGTRAVPVGGLSLQGCVVPAEARLGARGGGFKIALDAVNFARMIWGGIAVGLARAALDRVIAYLKERRQFGQRLADFQAIQFQLADLATEIEAARLLSYRAAALMDEGGRYIEAAAMAKRAAGDMAVRVTSAALELLGGRGYLIPNDIDRHARHARLALLADGTSNIQRLVIARGLLGG